MAERAYGQSCERRGGDLSAEGARRAHALLPKARVLALLLSTAVAEPPTFRATLIETAASGATTDIYEPKAPCNVFLTEEISERSYCGRIKSFGCSDKNHMFVDRGCRGDFMCGGAAIRCESWEFKRMTCMCGQDWLNQSAMTTMMDGLFEGLDPSRHTAAQCRVAFHKVGSPVTTFIRAVAESCTSAEASCVSTISDQLVRLSNLTGDSADILDEITAYCPPQIKVLFTAAYDPLLPGNMMVMALLHMVDLHMEVRQVHNALAVHKHHDFGYHLGRALGLILPLVRFPLKQEDVTRVIAGFVESFARSVQGHMAEESNAFETNHSQVQMNSTLHECFHDVQGNLEQIENPIYEITMGSFLNYTCYKEALRGRPGFCLGRAAHGVVTLGGAIYASATLMHNLAQATCPPKFSQLIDQLRSPKNRTLEFFSNALVHGTEMDLIFREALDELYRNELFDFGFEMGKLVQRAFQPEFHNYQRLEFPWDGQWKILQVLDLVLIGSMLAFLSLAPLLCLFCSSFRGWPSSHQEITVSSPNDAPQLEVMHEFLGGNMRIGSEVEFIVQTADREESADEAEVLEKPRNGSSKSHLHTVRPLPPTGLASASKRLPLHKAHRELPHCYHAREVFDKASFCIRMTLIDDQLPDPRGRCYCNALTCVLGLAIPCLGSGPRRWQLQIFEQKDGVWRSLDKMSSLRSELTDWAYKQMGSCYQSGNSASSQSSPSVSDSENDAAALKMSRIQSRNVSFKPKAHLPHLAGSLVSPVSSDEGDAQQAFETQFYLNSRLVQAPVLDKMMVTHFSVHNIKAAVLRIRPNQPRKECWDALLFIAAGTQLAVSFWWESQFCLGALFHVVFEGISGLSLLLSEVPTFWLHWGMFASASLLIHKKLHARWHWRVCREYEVQPDDAPTDDGDCCGFVRRTQTHVPLFSKVATVRSRTPPLLPLFYRCRYDLEAGDLVRVAASHRDKAGMLCTVLDADPDENGEVTITFSHDEHRLRESDLELAEREARARREPVWEDRLSEWLLKSSLVVLGAGAICLLVLSNIAGTLVLRLDGNSYILNTWIVCIVIEAVMRVSEWMVTNCAQGACYAM